MIRRPLIGMSVRPDSGMRVRSCLTGTGLYGRDWAADWVAVEVFGVVPMAPGVAPPQTLGSAGLVATKGEADGLSKRRMHASRVGSRYGTAMKDALRLAIVDDYALVVAGVAALLAEERIDVVETATTLPIVSDVDIVLYDTFAQVQGQGIDLEDFVRDSGAKVVVYSWNLRQELIGQAITAGASGYLSKVLTGPAIVAALERIMAGETVILAGDHESSIDGPGDWPGRSEGLTPREAEVVALIAQGLSNHEIAERAFVSINSIKSYIRSAYRKMGVDSRSRAVLWAIAHGFEYDTERRLDPTLSQRPAAGSLPPP